jgi:hypothetical protein
MNNAEKERAMLVSPKEYPGEMPCAVCGYRWMQHRGSLCPKHPGYFSVILQRPIPPIMGDTTFIPDVAFVKEPDFDVI